MLKGHQDDNSKILSIILYIDKHIFPCHECPYDLTKNKLAVPYMNNPFVQIHLHVKLVLSS